MTIRVLLVDDSAFVRKVLREVLAQSVEIEVVGIARDGLEALEKIAELSPDVMTLDLMMPNLDGIGVLDALAGRPAPATVVVSTSVADSELVMQAFERGAVELVCKPTAHATDRLYELSSALVRAIHAAALARRAPRAAALSAQMTARPASHELLVIGTSTGGPQALNQLLPALPGDFPLPIAIALHIPSGYTEALARRIDEKSELQVVEAESGIELRPGRAVIARGGEHLRVQKRERGYVGWISKVPADSPHFPSVDVLFESAAEHARAGAMGVILTGMGNDGTRGARAIHAQGGMILTEAESSCVVYGMPRAAVEAGVSSGSAPLEQLASLIIARS